LPLPGSSPFWRGPGIREEKIVISVSSVITGGPNTASDRIPRPSGKTTRPWQKVGHLLANSRGLAHTVASSLS
jgi:hypothetical protein